MPMQDNQVAERSTAPIHRNTAKGGNRNPAGNQQETVPPVQVVEFLLGKEHFAIDLFDVKEVVEYTRITRLPNTPSYIKGIIDLRGEITTIIDLKEALAIAGEDVRSEEDPRIIVLDDQITLSKTGIMVDDVLSVSTFQRSQVDSSMAALHKENTQIIGIIKKKIRIKDRDSTELIIWIDVKQLLKSLEQGMKDISLTLDSIKSEVASREQDR
jgi:purine-binding chemotaxis protein CheW